MEIHWRQTHVLKIKLHLRLVLTSHPFCTWTTLTQLNHSTWFHEFSKLHIKLRDLGLLIKEMRWRLTQKQADTVHPYHFRPICSLHNIPCIKIYKKIVNSIARNWDVNHIHQDWYSDHFRNLPQPPLMLLPVRSLRSYRRRKGPDSIQGRILVSSSLDLEENENLRTWYNKDVSVQYLPRVFSRSDF